jgi:predicted dehydrogenase
MVAGDILLKKEYLFLVKGHVMSSEKNTLKFGIIGTGGRGISCFGQHFCEEKDVDVVALCDPNQVRMEIASKELEGEQNLYTTVDDMLKNENLDGVAITSPDFCHEQNAVDCLKNGVNVLIDKPLATNVKGCKHIIDEAEKSGKIVMMGFNMRHNPVLVKLKQIIDDGVLGRIFFIDNREFYNGGRTYMARWNRLYKNSGGLWNHKGSHDFDVFNWLLDHPKPVKVSSIAGVSVLNKDNIPFEVKPGVEVGPTCSKCPYKDICPDYSEMGEIEKFQEKAQKVDGYAKDLCIYTSDKDTHDNGIAIVEYDNGVRVSHMECFVTPTTDRQYTICGTKGQAEISLHKRTITVQPRWTEEIIEYKLPEPKGGHGGADPKLVKSFINAIKGEAENNSTCEQGMWSTSIAEAAERSWREDRTVFVKELFE